MKEFRLLGQYAPSFIKLDGFTQSYIKSIFFTEQPYLASVLGTEPAFFHLTTLALELIKHDCRRFCQEAGDALDLASAFHAPDGCVHRAAGMDFWFSRRGHGQGFMRGDWQHVGHSLHQTAMKFPRVRLMVRDKRLLVAV